MNSHPALPARPAHQAQRTQASLHATLDRIQDHPPEYGDQLSSHLPMAVHALFRLGAEVKQVEAFMSSYAARFEGRRLNGAGQALPDWREALGRFEAFADLRCSFAKELALRGRDVLLGQVLPVLLPGMSAVAFHGLIRTAHAVEGEHDGELASALAYWACRWQTLPPPPTPTPPTLASPSGRAWDLDAWSQALVDGARGWRSEAPLIFLRMQEACATPLYAELAQGLKSEPRLAERVAQLAHLALGYYLASGNFTVLHMITGLRALRVLLPWLPEHLHVDPAVQNLLGQAFVAAYLAGRVQTRLPANEAAAPLSWFELVSTACESKDDHAIKLVHACGDEMSVYGDRRYVQAAALALRSG